MLAYILGTLTDTDVEWLADHGDCRRLAAGQEVLREGERNPDLFLVLEGALRQAGVGSDGERLGPGEMAGLISLLDGRPAPAGFEAEEEALVMRLAEADVRQKLGLDIGFAARFYRALAVLEAGRWRARYAESRAEGEGDPGPPPEAADLGLVEDRMRRLLRRLDPDGEITITGEDLTVEQVAKVAWQGARVAVAESARQTIRRSREVVNRLAAQPEPVYGLTTNLGELKEERIPEAAQETFQRHILLSHAAGVGPDHPADVVRAIMVTRLNGAARGGAGMQPAVFDTLVAMLNAGVTPRVPSRGSIGMADLVPLAHMALPLIGEGEVELAGERLSGADGLAAAGIEPPQLAAKDGLALVSANSASVGQAALAVVRARDALALGDIAVALSLEALGGHTGVLDVEVDSARRFSGQLICAEEISLLLEGSSLWTTPPTLDVQDPISFRSAIQVHGAVLDILGSVRATLETELNSTGDNPMVLADRGEMLSTGNFHPAGLSIALDTLAISLAQFTSMASNRIVRLMDTHFTELPIYLAANPSRNVGLGVIQKTATALNAEVRLGANPASLDYVPVAGSIEDHATMAVEGAAKASRAVDATLSLVAIELLVAAQAIDLRPGITLGAGTRAVHQLIRSHVPAALEDHLLADDISAVRALIDDGSVQRVAGEAIGRRLGGTVHPGAAAG
jgi:histidine ammonia-lyase